MAWKCPFKKTPTPPVVIPPVVVPPVPPINPNIMDWTTLKPIDLSLIEAVDFPNDKYYPIDSRKTQITIHHTVSGPGVRGDINHWLSLSGRIATCIIIDNNGIAYQCFSSKFWAHHLGITSTYLKSQGYTDWTTRNVELNQGSIAVEIDNWGGLILGDGSTKQFGLKEDKTPNMVKTVSGKYYAAYGNVVDCEIQHYPNGYRGYNYYEKYNNLQLATLGSLLLLWHIKYQIPLDYHPTMFDISKDALSGKEGVWSHTSYREDKSDIHPQPELIDMLQSLKPAVFKNM